MLQSPIHLRRNISSINLADVMNDFSGRVNRQHTSREQHNSNIERVQLPIFTGFRFDVSETKCPNIIDTLYLETAHTSCLLRQSPESGMQHYSCQQKVDSQELHLLNSHFPPSLVLMPENSMALQNNNWDENILRECYRTPRSIVLESFQPWLTPHIMITLAEETGSEFYTAWLNQTNYQHPEYLSVPSCPLAAVSQMWPPASPSSSLPSKTLPSESPVPRKIFKRSKFSHQVSVTAEERTIICDLVKTLQKHQCKAAAFATSVAATSFTKQCSSSFDKQWQWIDPGQPFIESSRHTLGSIILESHCPFAVPHIIINTPPPHNPWITYTNILSNPQDCGRGAYLTVPSQYVEYVNIPEELELDPYESDAVSCVSSQPSSPGPPTPRCIDDYDFKFTIQGVDSSDDSEDEDEEPSLYHKEQELEPIWTLSHCSTIPEIETGDTPYGSKSLLESISKEDADDNEDGPPPFDAWYTRLPATCAW